MRSLLLLLPGLLAMAQTPAPMKKVSGSAAKTAKTAETAPVVKNFKEAGSAAAPMQIEIYTDYECPACRDLYLNTLPLLSRDYVQTGKVRLLHRDFPLQQHKYSPIATRYANAAGMIGKYDVVAAQIFQTQPAWAQSGNVDAEVAKVLPPADLQKVRDLAKGGDPKLDDTVQADVAMGNKDNLRQTPTIVFVYKGKREVIGGGMPYSIMKTYIDKKLAE